MKVLLELSDEEYEKFKEYAPTEENKYKIECAEIYAFRSILEEILTIDVSISVEKRMRLIDTLFTDIESRPVHFRYASKSLIGSFARAKMDIHERSVKYWKEEKDIRNAKNDV